jgi:hypothetical protein
MKLILKFTNGAEQFLEISDNQLVPDVFNILSDPEGANFWFEHCDDLPSGAVLFKETTRDRVNQIWRGE